MADDLERQLRELPAEYPGLEALSDDVLYLMGCRSFEQFCKTLAGIIDPEHHCPFCTESGKVFAGQPLWYAKENDFPIRGVRNAILLVPRRHLTNPWMLDGNDWREIGILFELACSLYEIEGGGMIMRFGTPRSHAGTIPHLHINVLEPSGDIEYRAPLSKNEPDRIENYRRLLEHHATMMAAGGVGSVM